MRKGGFFVRESWNRTDFPGMAALPGFFRARQTLCGNRRAFLPERVAFGRKVWYAYAVERGGAAG